MTRLTFFCAAVLLMPSLQGTTVEYHEDFEGGSGGYSRHPLSSDNSWEYGESPTDIAGDNTCWATGLETDYNPDEISSIWSPEIDLSGVADGRVCYLGWWQHVDVEENHDRITVEISGNAGASWRVLRARTHGFETGWHYVRSQLPEEACTDMTRVRFRLNSDETEQRGGWFVDDVMIISVPVHDEVYHESFETDDGSFAVTGTSPTWEWGECTNPTERSYYPHAAAHGSRVWGTDLDGVHNYLDDSLLTSPVIPLPDGHEGRDFVISWDHYLLLTEAQFSVELKMGDGQWESLFESPRSYMAAHWDWQYAVFPYEDMGAETQVRFHFRAFNDWYVHGGAYLDDVRMFIIPRIHAESNGYDDVTGQQAQEALLGEALTMADAHECLAIRLEVQPENGTVRCNGRALDVGEIIPAWAIQSLYYQPDPTFVGTDQFSWSQQDFFGGWSDHGTMDIVVEDRDVAPMLRTAAPCLSLDEDTPLVLDLDQLFFDPDDPDAAGEMTYSLTANYAQNLLDATIVEGNLRLAPKVDEIGSGVLEIRACSGELYATEAVDFEILSINDPPVLQDPHLEISEENENLKAAWSGWSDPDETSAAERSCTYEWYVDGQLEASATQDTLSTVDYPDASAFVCRITPADMHESGQKAELCVLVYDLCSGWNLLGLPLTPDSGEVSKLSEAAVGNLFLWEEGGYGAVETPHPGEAFWLFAEGADRIVIAGSSGHDAKAMRKGWNLLSVPVGNQNGTVSSLFPRQECWSWDSSQRSYRKPQWLDCVCGYWVWLVSQP